MKIEIEISDDQSQDFELGVIRDRYENYSKLQEIFNHARNILKHGEPKDYEAALEEIKQKAGVWYD